MKFKYPLSIFFLATTIVISCKKQDANADLPQADKSPSYYKNGKVPVNFFKELTVPGIAATNASLSANLIENDTTPDPNNGDDPIVLGQQQPNPYTIANMQQAYLQLYGSTAPVPVTHLYIRYKPATQDQLATLLNQPNLELQDYPMDYQIIQDGDYYQDPTLGTEDIGWLYSAVPANYTPVSGIQYEVIQQLHIPANDDLLLESMAESLAGGAIYEDTVILVDRYITRVDEPSDTLIIPNRMPIPCELDPCFPECPNYDPMLCGGGGGGSSSNPQIPRGKIEVEDQSTCNTSITPIVNVPVRQARIVCKRWFKIWTGYTDNQGSFLATKKFKNKVKVIIKTENNNAKVAKVRGIRLWQIMFPVKKRLGVYDQLAMANISYVFRKPNPTNAHDKELPYWVAATTHNSILEYGQYAAEAGILNHPTNLNILITNWGFQRAAGAAPMWNKCHILNSELNLLQGFVQYFIIQPTLSIVPFFHVLETLKNETDVVIGYAATAGNYSCLLTSASLKAVVYHELGHTSHFAQAGCNNWQAYRTRISNELSFGNPNTRPYGDGTETNAGIIAVGEMWGNHIEKIFSERYFTNPVKETFSIGLSKIYINDGSQLGNYGGYITSNLAGLNANFAAIEDFNPNRVDDVHRWIPQGLCYDLFDSRNDNNSNTVIENVSGYTTLQCFNALQSDVRTIPAFKDRLLQQNSYSQQTQVNTLFNEYNY